MNNLVSRLAERTLATTPVAIEPVRTPLFVSTMESSDGAAHWGEASGLTSSSARQSDTGHFTAPTPTTHDDGLLETANRGSIASPVPAPSTETPVAKPAPLVSPVPMAEEKPAASFAPSAESPKAAHDTTTHTVIKTTVASKQAIPLTPVSNPALSDQATTADTPLEPHKPSTASSRQADTIPPPGSIMHTAKPASAPLQPRPQLIVSPTTGGDRQAKRAAGENTTPVTPPTIEVTIGRVDIRAVNTPPPKPTTRTAKKTPASLTLDDYLKQRSGGKA